MITMYMMQVILCIMYKVKSGYTPSPKIFFDMFNQRKISSYNLRTHPEFRVSLTRTAYHGSGVFHIWVQRFGIFSRHHLWKQFR